VASPPASTLQPGPRPERFPLVWPSKTTSFGGTLSFDDDAVERAVCAWFRQQTQEFKTTGFQGFVKLWDKCLNLYGDFIEK